MSTVLITGGAGYVGSHVALDLLDAGRRVVIIDDLSTGSQEAVPQAASFFCGDIRDEELTARVIAECDVAAIVHMAAMASVPESVADPVRCHSINVAGTQSLLQAAAQNGVTGFIFSSTSTVYDENAPLPFCEDAPTGPISPYAITKLAGEELLRQQTAMRGVVLRYFNVAGADPLLRAGDRKRDSTLLIKSALECAAGKRAGLKIFGDDYPTADGTCVRDYVHVSDIARAHRLALDYVDGGGQSDVFNLGVGRGFSVREVLSAVRQVTAMDFAEEIAPRREGDPPSIYANSDKARRVLHFVPQRPQLETIVADAWAWERHLQPAD
ncbi:MAG: UDP-glucose 4-epimerase GalE [Gammaproteobacteria bacterium]